MALSPPIKTDSSQFGDAVPETDLPVSLGGKPPSLGAAVPDDDLPGGKAGVSLRKQIAGKGPEAPLTTVKKGEAIEGGGLESSFLGDPITQAALFAASGGVAPAFGIESKLAGAAVGAGVEAPAWATAGVAFDALAKKIAPNHPWIQAAISNGLLFGAPVLGARYLNKLAARRPLVQPMEEAEGTAEALPRREPQPEAPIDTEAPSADNVAQTPALVSPEAPSESSPPAEPQRSTDPSQRPTGVTRDFTPQELRDRKVAQKKADDAYFEARKTGKPQEELAAAIRTGDKEKVKDALPVELERAPAADVHDIPTDKIDTDPERLQYKVGYGKEGAGLALNKAKTYNRKLGGVLTLMENPDDPERFLAVNGHQRLALAKRSGETPLRSQILPKGTTFEQARGIGAMINMAEERGTAIDAAKFMRDYKATPEQLAAEGIDLSAPMMDNALALKNLDDNLFRDVSTGRMKPGMGVVIGRELGDNKPAQQAIATTMRDLEKRGESMNPQKLQDMIRDAKDTENETGTTTDLFGTKTIEQNFGPQRADIMGYVRENLAKDKRLFGTAAREAKRLEGGGTKVGVEQAKGISEAAATRMAALEARGPATQAIVRKYAPELAAASKGERPKILQKAYGEAFDALEKDFGAQKELGGVKPPEAPSTPSPADERAQIAARAEQRSQEMFAQAQASPEAKKGAAQAAEMAESVDERMAKEPTEFYSGLPVSALARRLEPLTTRIRDSFRETFRPEAISEASESAYASINARDAEKEWRAYHASNAFHQALKGQFEKLSPTQRWSVVDNYERGNMGAIPAEMRPYFDAYRKVTDAAHDALTSVRAGGQQGLYGKTVGFIDNYIGHMWKNDQQQVSQAYSSMLGSLKQSSPFLKGRKIPFISEGIKGGLTPKYDNPADMMLANVLQQWKYTTGERILQDGKDAGWVKRFTSPGETPPGWERVPDPISNILQYSEPEKGMVQRGFYAAPKEYNRVIDRYLHPSNMGPLTKNLYHLKNIGAGLKVGLSLFHPLLTSTAVMLQDSGGALLNGLEDIAHGDFKNAAMNLASAPLKAINFLQPIKDRAVGAQMMKMVRDGAFSDPGVQRMIEGGMTPGTRIAAEVATDSMKSAMHIPGHLEKLLGGIMENWVRPLKIGQFNRLLNEQIDRHIQQGVPLTGTALKKMAADTAAHSDWLLGQVGAHRLLMSTTMRDATRLAVNFPGWQVGTLKILGGAVRGATETLAGRSMDTQARLAMKYLAGLAVFAPLYGTMADIVTTGKPPKDLRSAYIDAADTLPIYGLRDAVSLAGHVAGEGWKSGAGRYVSGKISWPLITAAEIFWANRDPTNWQQLRYPSQSMPEQATSTAKALIKQVAPFSLLTGAEQYGRDVQSGDVATPAREMAKVALKGTFGVRPPPPSLERSATDNFIMQNKPKFDRAAASPEEAQRWQAKYAVASQIRAGKPEQALQAFNNAVRSGALNRDVDAKSIAHMVKDPVGSAIEESSLPFAFEFWKFAESQHDPVAKEKVEAGLIKKLRNGGWSKLAPKEQMAYRDTLMKIIKQASEESEGARP